MCALANLISCNLGTRVPVLAQHCITKSPRAICICSLANDEHAVFLFDRDWRVERCHAWLDLGCSLHRRKATNSLYNLTQMLRSGSATTADDSDAQIRDMVTMKLSQLSRGEIVMCLAVNDAWQSGVRQHADWERTILAEITQVLLHF